MNPVLPTLAAILAACLYLVGLTLDLFWLKLLTKPWPVLGLALAAWILAERDTGKWIAGGLVSGAIGDVCLALPNAFLAGMLAFALGHACYVAAFIRWNRTSSVLLLAPVAAFSCTGLWLMWPGAGTFAYPLLAYILIISIMLWRAAACAMDTDPDLLRRWGPLAGALFFGFSDMLIGLNRFHQPIDGVAIPIILTYWAGQWLIARAAVARR